MSEKFISLTRDTVFKTLWTQGNKYVRRYLERMVEYALGHPLKEYTLSYNELGKISIESIANKVDILLVSKDGLEKTNIEMNRIINHNSGILIEQMMNKSNIYLSNIVSTFYNDKREKLYKVPIKVEQVNFNTFYFGSNKDISKLSFELVDRTYNVVREGIKMHHLYLPSLRDMCYNEEVKDIYKDFAMMLSETYEEMESLAAGNKEREEVVKFMRHLKGDEEFMAIIDREEYNQIMYENELEEAKKEAIAEGHAKGHAEGHAEGRAEGHAEGYAEGTTQTILENAKNFYQNGVSRELILKSLDIEESTLDAIIKEVNETRNG